MKPVIDVCGTRRTLVNGNQTGIVNCEWLII